jgi:hypothetical protein
LWHFRKAPPGREQEVELKRRPRYHFATRYAPKSEAWQEQQSPPIGRFWCDDGTCWGIPFFQVAFTHYHPEEQSLLIECSPGIIVVMGPKAWEFYDRFCGHKVSLLKADGKDILAVTMALRSAGTT